MRHRLSLLHDLRPQLPARRRFSIERLRNRRRPTHLTETQDLHLIVAAVVLHLQHVADSNLPRRLGSLSVRLNPAQFTRPPRERPRLKESSGPEPLVHPHARLNPTTKL